MEPAGGQEIVGSLRRLEVDEIDLYYQHRVDPQVPGSATCFGLGAGPRRRHRPHSRHYLGQKW